MFLSKSDEEIGVNRKLAKELVDKWVSFLGCSCFICTLLTLCQMLDFHRDVIFNCLSLQLCWQSLNMDFCPRGFIKCVCSLEDMHSLLSFASPSVWDYVLVWFLQIQSLQIPYYVMCLVSCPIFIGLYMQEWLLILSLCALYLQSRPIFNKSTRFEDMRNAEDDRAPFRRPPVKKYSLAPFFNICLMQYNIYLLQYFGFY